MTRYLFVILLFYLVYTSVARDVVTAYYDPQAQQWSYASVEDPSGVATAVFFSELNTTGWDRLYVRTNPSYSNELQAHAAGECHNAKNPTSKIN